jgi:ankyrin repeat protein
MDHGADINAQDGPYGNALNAASLKGCATLVSMLVEKYGADPRLTDSQGRNAFHFAAHGGNVEIMDYFLNLSLNLNFKDKGAYSAIHYAASGASLAAVDRILQSHSTDCAEDHFWSPLHWACRAGDPQILKLLVEKGIKANAVSTSEPPGRWTPIAIAFFHQNRKLVTADGGMQSELIKLQDDCLETIFCSGRIPHASSAQERSSYMQARKHADCWCNGCFHVRPQIKRGSIFTNSTGYIWSTFSLPHML